MPHQEFAAQLPPDFWMSVFEATPQPQALLAPDFRIIAVNAAYLRASESPRSQLVGRSLFEAFPENPDAREANAEQNMRTSLQRVLQTHTPDEMPIQRYDIPVPDGQGFTERYWRPLNTPVLGPHGEVLAILHSVEDVTEVVHSLTRGQQSEFELDRVMMRQAQALERANASRDEFLSVVSHELRTPLHVLMGFLSILRKPGTGPLNDAQQVYVDKLNDVTLKLVRLVEDILVAGRMRAGTFLLHREAIELPAVIDLALRELAPLIKSTDHRLECELPEGLPPLQADPDRLGQVIYNLLSNAIKFSPEGTPVCLRACREGGHVRVEVIDQGVGIAEADQRRLFQRFTQLDMSSRRSARGTGLGLAISREIVEAHGGAIGVESTPGSGSTFWFTLPLG